MNVHEFLRARLDEEEAYSQIAVPVEPPERGRWRDDVAAKRRILADYDRVFRVVGHIDALERLAGEKGSLAGAMIHGAADALFHACAYLAHAYHDWPWPEGDE